MLAGSLNLIDQTGQCSSRLEVPFFTTELGLWLHAQRFIYALRALSLILSSVQFEEYKLESCKWFAVCFWAAFNIEAYLCTYSCYRL